MFLNKATIIGNLTRDPELKQLPSGNAVCNFSVATNRVWKDKNTGAKQEAVEYHNIVVFGHMANSTAKHMTKGAQILVEGRLQTQSWDDAASGKKMYRTEIVADNIQFGRKATGSAPNQAKDPHAPIDISTPAPAAEGSLDSEFEYPEEDINPEDIPF